MGCRTIAFWSAYLIKFASDGTPLWAAGVDNGTGSAVQIDGNGEVVLGGTYYATESNGKTMAVYDAGSVISLVWNIAVLHMIHAYLHCIPTRNNI